MEVIVFEKKNVETNAPWYKYSPRSIKFSSKVKKIGMNAFAGLDIKTVNFESGGNVDIGNKAFAYCYNLVNFDFSYVTSIGPEAFAYCYNLKGGANASFTKLVSIGTEAFYQCLIF